MAVAGVFGQFAWILTIKIRVQMLQMFAACFVFKICVNPGHFYRKTVD